MQQNYAFFSENHLSDRLELRFVEDLLEMLEDVVKAILIPNEGFQLSLQDFWVEDGRRKLAIGEIRDCKILSNVGGEFLHIMKEKFLDF